MTIRLPASDPSASATFVAGILAAEVAVSRDAIAVRMGGGDIVHFRPSGSAELQHCSVLLDEDGFDAAYGRLLDGRTQIWADIDRRRPAEIGHRAGGRVLCFADPDGNLIQLVTTPEPETAPH